MERLLAVSLPQAGSVRKTSVRFLTIEVSGNSTLEIALNRIESMIVHYVQHHTNARLMQSLYHLLDIADT